ncbi:hypothetical protein MPPM_2031 [Methylorubrum populi]|uniref:Uncharacterized protein n=1 Tax=Methylorubrum populi TaxID=223967 RepID=A0A160PDR3_9HYPH|nr:hypothetical protein MPPM_2031 [Methylorubrum populi]GLS52479.1 hypothetical protein GCM10007886_06620 [Methylobacterium gregans]
MDVFGSDAHPADPGPRHVEEDLLFGEVAGRTIGADGTLADADTRLIRAVEDVLRDGGDAVHLADPRGAKDRIVVFAPRDREGAIKSDSVQTD